MKASDIVEISPETIITEYARAYQQLYKRMPKDLRALDMNWVIVNGARIRISELQYLTHQLQQEYAQTHSKQKNTILRLIKWFKG